MNRAPASRRTFLLEGSIPRAMLILLGPIVLTSQIGVLIDLAESFWMGRLGGTAGLSVAATMAPVEQIRIALFMSLSVGIGSLVARAVGAGTRDSMHVVASGTLFALFVGCAFTVVGLLLLGPLGRLLGSDLGLAREVRSFFVPLLLGLPALAVLFAMISSFNATGFPRYGTLRAVAELIITATITPLLMGPLGLGVAGPPASAALGAVAVSGSLWVTLVRRRELLGLGDRDRSRPLIDWALWKRILWIGAPLQIGRLSTFVMGGVLVQVVHQAGRADTAGYGIAFRLVLVTMFTSFGLSRASAVMIGQNLGAKKRERVLASLKVASLFGAAFSVLVILVLPLARPVVRLFTDDPAVIAAALHALSIMRVAIVGTAGWQILSEAYGATGTTRLAGLLLMVGDGAALLVTQLAPLPPLDRAAWAFVTQHLGKALVMLLLLRRSFLRPVDAATAIK